MNRGHEDDDVNARLDCLDDPTRTLTGEGDSYWTGKPLVCEAP